MLSLLSMLGCKKAVESQHAHYHWIVSESASEEYAMQIISGHLETADGYQKGIPTRVTLRNGWGKGRSTIVSGPDTMTLPVSMEVTWFSYHEDTFYRGKFDLPYDKIAAAFASQRSRPYTGDDTENNGSFIVGVAPEGFVVVWMHSHMQRRVIFTGFAEPVNDVPWEAVFDNPEFTKEYIVNKTVQETIEKAKGSPHLSDPQYWQRLHSELYQYDIVIESEYTPYDINTSFLDKASFSYYHEDSALYQKEKRSMLRGMTIAYLFDDRAAAVPISKINTDEMYAAFRHLSKNNDGKLRLVITVEGSLLTWGYRPRIRVENDKEAIEIKGFEFRAIDGSDMLRFLKGNKHMQGYVNHLGKPATP